MANLMAKPLLEAAPAAPTSCCHWSCGTRSAKVFANISFPGATLRGRGGRLASDGAATPVSPRLGLPQRLLLQRQPALQWELTPQGFAAEEGPAAWFAVNNPGGYDTVTGSGALPTFKSGTGRMTARRVIVCGHRVTRETQSAVNVRLPAAHSERGRRLERALCARLSESAPRPCACDRLACCGAASWTGYGWPSETTERIFEPPRSTDPHKRAGFPLWAKPRWAPPFRHGRPTRVEGLHPPNARLLTAERGAAT